MSDERKDLPPANSPQFLERVREALSTYLGNRGNKLDRGVTLRDLADSGVIDVNPRYLAGGRGNPIGGAGSAVGSASGVAYESDLTPPPTPTGFTASAGLNHVFITCATQAYTAGHGHAKSILYGKERAAGDPVPLFGAARVLREFTGTVDAFPSNLGVTWHLWLKWVSVDGEASVTPAGGTNGEVATTGKIGNADLNALIIEAGNLANGSVSASKLAALAVDATKFANGIEPISVVTGTLPVAKSTSTIFRTDDQKLYRWNGSAYIATVPAADLSGQLTSAQIADLAATKITGTMTSAQIADLAATKVTGQIVSTQITDNAITTAKINAGAITAAKIAADTITANEIAANAITASEIAVGAITTGKIAAGAVTAGTIAAGAIVAGDISAGAITTAKLAAGAVTANEIAANAITAGKIQAGAIGATEIAAGAITTNKLLVTGRGAALNDDPYTTDLTAWGFAGAALVTDTTCPVGTSVIETAANTWGVSRRMTLDAARNYQYRFWLKGQVGTCITYGMVQFFDANNNVVYTTGTWPGEGSYSYFGIVGGAAPAGWTEYVASFGPNETMKIPAGAKTFAIGAILNYSGSSGGATSRVAGLRVFEKAAADMIVDGSISATKLSAGAIAVGSAAIQNGAIVNAMIGAAAIDDAKIANLSAAKITTGSLDAARIVSGSLDAKIANLDAAVIGSGYINAARINTASIGNATIGEAQITGTISAAKVNTTSLSALSATIGLLRTATSGERTEIADNVIRVYDSSNVLRVKLGNLA